MSTAIEDPRRGQWIALTISDGRTLICRFACSRISRRDEGEKIWEVDHGAYGVYRDDLFIRSTAIASWTVTKRPRLRLSFVNPFGKRCFVGRYMTSTEANTALGPMRKFASNVTIEALA